MTLTKVHIIEAIRKQTGFPKNHSSEIFETLLELIKSSLGSGEDLLISGFGKFYVKEKAERIGRNPATGEAKIISSRRVVTFKCSGKLRERLNDQN